MILHQMKKNTFSIQNKIMIDLLNFREEAKLSKSILLYFTIYFYLFLNINFLILKPLPNLNIMI